MNPRYATERAGVLGTARLNRRGVEVDFRTLRVKPNITYKTLPNNTVEDDYGHPVPIEWALVATWQTVHFVHCAYSGIVSNNTIPATIRTIQQWWRCDTIGGSCVL